MRIVRTGSAAANAALRAEAKESGDQIGSIPNGTKVETMSDDPVYDPVSRRRFVPVWADGKIGWIASSPIGMR